MPISEPQLIPVLHVGVILTNAPQPEALDIQLSGAGGRILPVPGGLGRILIDPIPQQDLTLVLRQNGTPLAGSPLKIQVGGWSGAVDRVEGDIVFGRARNLRRPTEDVTVVAFTPDGQMAFATAAQAAHGGQFRLRLPAAMIGGAIRQTITLGIAGSDYLLDRGILPAPEPLAARGTPTPRLQRQPLQQRAIRIKISCPNLKEAPQWGDFHFANSLCAAFETLGLQAGVDTVDNWYAQPAQEDVVLALRGRHRLKVDRNKINIMWMISHPDRIPDDEFADFDHIAVASDIYAAQLRARGLPSVSVMHQATDAALFRADASIPRKPSCLFVGNSRREYRTMVKWCVESDVPFDLYGGGWDGVLPEEMIRAPSVANKDLASYYAGHLILLNDHWDSMRENGFLSNRLFDGSATGTPIITDGVAGLAEVFGDSISVADTIGDFAVLVRACLADPAPFLARAERARQIVRGAHTFDHRAAELAALIDRLASRKHRSG